MGSTDYKDVDDPSEKIAKTNAMLARNAVHLAGLLKQSGYPGASQ